MVDGPRPAPADSPLLATGSVLDERQRGVIQRVSAAEHAGILALPGDHPLDPKRLARVRATHPEMHAQPQAVRATLATNRDAIRAVAARLAAREIDRVFLVGAGDSHAVMLAARMAMEALLGVPCEPVQSLEFAYYVRRGVDERAAVLALSSSGETTRTVEAALVAQHAGAFTVALTNTAGSTLDVECDHCLLLSATRVGWPTQSSTAALALLYALAVATAELRGDPAAQRFGRELAGLPELMAHVLAETEPVVAGIAEREAACRMFLFSGGGPNWASAVMGAAKVKECTPDHALAIQVEEYHHYNSQKPGEPLWLIAPAGRSVPRAVHTGREAIRFGGQLYTVTTEGEPSFDDFSNSVITVPTVSEEFSPLLCVLPAQLVGYHLAMAKFRAATAQLDA